MKKIIYILLLLTVSTLAQDIRGTGTIIDPYILFNASDLDSIRYLGLDKYYVLDRDISLSAYNDWTPIDNFTGHFDGRYHRITNLKITTTHTNNGLFGYLSSGDLKRVILDTVLITLSTSSGSVYVGSLLGRNISSNIDSCFVRNSNISISLGFLVNLYAGGVIGHGSDIARTNIMSSSITTHGQSSNGAQIGGFIGATQGNVSQCFAYISLLDSGSSNNYIGGFVGLNYIGTLSDNYFRGSLVEKSKSAALFRYANNGNNIYRSYAAGTITAVGDISIFDGNLDGSSSSFDSFTDSTVANLSITSFDNNPATEDAVAKSTSDMKTQSTYTDSGWNFTSIWSINPSINDGYPYLRYSPIELPDALPYLISLKIDYPNGNEVLDGEDTITVRASSVPTLSLYKFYYSLNAGNTWIYIGQSANDSISWIIPDTSVTKARIMVTDEDSTIIDISDNSFVIQSNKVYINILSPINLSGNHDSVNVTWESIAVNKFDLYWSSDSLTWNPVALGINKNIGDNISPDTTSYNWTTLDSFGKIYIKVSSDTSDRIILTKYKKDWKYAGERTHYGLAQGVVTHTKFFYYDDKLYTVWFFAFVYGWYDYSDQVGINRFNVADTTWESVSKGAPNEAYYPSLNNRLRISEGQIEFYLFNGGQSFYGDVDNRYKRWIITPNNSLPLTTFVKDIEDEVGTPPSQYISNDSISYNGYKYYLDGDSLILAKNLTTSRVYNFARIDSLVSSNVLEGIYVADGFVHLGIYFRTTQEYVDYVTNTLELPSNKYGEDIEIGLSYNNIFRDYFRGIHPKIRKD